MLKAALRYNTRSSTVISERADITRGTVVRVFMGLKKAAEAGKAAEFCEGLGVDAQAVSELLKPAQSEMFS